MAENAYIWSNLETMPFYQFIELFLMIGKLFLWDCRKSQILPKIQGFQAKINIKYETESKIDKKFFGKKLIVTQFN